MRENESKQDWALRVARKLNPLLLELLMSCPEYGVISLSVVLYEGAVQRVFRRYKESILRVEDEPKTGFNQKDNKGDNHDN